jgi:hypothetical protein
MAMRFLGLLVILAALVFGVGYYQGWFRLSSHSTDGRAAITLTVDKDKVSADKQTAQDKVQELGHQTKDAVSTTAPTTSN